MSSHAISNHLFPSEPYVSATSFDSLPSEVVAKILCNLDLEDKKNARLVDQLWRSVVEDEYSANPIVLRPVLTNKSLNYFLNAQKRVDHVIFKNITRIMPRTWESRFPRINQIEIGEGNSEQQLVNIFKHGCEDTESFKIGNYALEKITRRTLKKVLNSGSVKWGHLGKLSLCMLVTHSEYYRSLKHMDTMVPLLKLAHIPTLKEFEFEFEFEFFFDVQDRFQGLIESVYEFLHHHSNSLKILKGQIENSGTRQLNLPEIPKAIKIKEMKFEKFFVTFRRIVNVELFVCLVLCGTQLKTLGIHVVKKGMTFREIVEPDPHFPALYSQVGSIIHANGPTLASISLDLQQIRLSWLQNCVNLEYLKFKEIENILIHESNLNHEVKKLKSLFINNERNGSSKNGLPIGLQEFILQNSETLEKISLFRASEEDGHWLRACVNLKSLAVIVFTEGLLQTKTDFLKLKTLETPLSRRIGTGIWEWMKEAVKNLEQITILGSFTDLTTIKSLLTTLPMLRRIIFSVRGRAYGRTVASIMAKFCESKPGLKFLPYKQKQRDNSQYSRIIYVNRRLFNNLSGSDENQN